MTILESVKELNESVTAWQKSLNELERVMLERGFITQESLERARTESDYASSK